MVSLVLLVEEQLTRPGPAALSRLAHLDVREPVQLQGLVDEAAVAALRLDGDHPPRWPDAPSRDRGIQPDVGSDIDDRHSRLQQVAEEAAREGFVATQRQ